MQALLIDGLNFYIGDSNSLPSFASGRPHGGSLVGSYIPSYSIDPLGGIGKVEDLTFKILDDGPVVQAFTLDVFDYDFKAGVGAAKIDYNQTSITLDDVTGIAPGDAIYAPQDTWIVTAVDTTTNTIDVTRGAYSSTSEAILKTYHGNVGLDYVCLVGHNKPITTFGRWVALYEDGSLVYLGIINGIAQKGKYWEIKTKSLTTIISDYANPERQYRLGGAGGDSGWWVYTAFRVTVSYDGGITGFDMPVLENKTKLQAETTIGQAVFTGTSGAFTFGDGGLTKDKYFTLDCMESLYPHLQAIDSTPGQKHEPSGDYNMAFSMPEGLKNYVFTFSIGATLNLPDIQGYINGKTVKVGDYYIKINDSGVVEAIYNSHLEPISFGGIVQDTPIQITEKTVYYNTISGVLKDFLTDPVSGLGLPASMVTDAVLNMDSVVVDFSDGLKEDLLKAFSLGIIWSAGGLKIKKITPPEHGTETVDTGKAPISWGRWAPIGRLSVTNFGDSYNQTIEYSQLPTGVQRQKVEYKLDSYFFNDIFTIWSPIALRQMKWLSQYLPSIQIKLPGVDLELGDTVNIKTELGAQVGYYGFDNMPGLVVAKKGYDYTFVLNPSSSHYRVSWAPSARLLSQNGNDVTVDRVWNGLEAGSYVDFYSTPEYNTPGTQYKIARVNGDTIALENTAYTYSTNKYGYALTNDWAQDILTLSRSSIWHIRVYIDSSPKYAYGRIIGIIGSWASGSWSRLMYLVYNDKLKMVYWYYKNPSGIIVTTSKTAYAPIVNDQWIDIVALYNRDTGTFGVWSPQGSGAASGLDLYDGYVTAKIVAFNQQPAYSAGFTGRLSHVMFYNGIGITDIDEAVELVLSQSLDSQLFIKYDFGKSLNPVDEVSGHDMGGATYLYLTQNNLPLANYPHFTVPTYADTNQDPKWQARYAFAANTTGNFSNGDPGKEYV